MLAHGLDPSQVWNYVLFTVGEASITLGSILIAIVLLLIAPKLSRLITRVLERRLIDTFVEDPASKVTYRTITFYAALGLLVAMSLNVAGIPLTVFTVVGGALAIGVGFGSQNIVNNFISGMILLVERPVKVGDIVELDGGLSGTILTIGTRSTKLRNLEGKIFIVPNSFFLEKSVLNWTFSSPEVRTSVVFGVAYGSDVRLVENICMDVLLNTEAVMQAPLPQVVFDEFADSSLTFKLNFWCDVSKNTLALVRSEIRFKIDERFRHHGVVIAFPQRDLHLLQPKPLEVRVLT
jgi:small-conductance mechanosensitive channel